MNQSQLKLIKLAQKQLSENESKDGILENETIFQDSRIKDYKPILLPKRGEFTRRLIEHYHLKTIHGGVQSTMTKIREKFWIPNLRSLVKTLVHKCNLCKKGRLKKMKSPFTSDLPTMRTEFMRAWTFTGVDLAGPIYYKIKVKKGPAEVYKCYLVLFTCATTRAVHLAVVLDQSAEAFQRALQEFIVRRDRPNYILSDNGGNFVNTANWIKTLKTDDDLQNYLAKKEIVWKFNLAKAPWWGGIWERLIGITKKALFKATGRALLTMEELKDTMLDVESFMNNRPLTYLGEEPDQKVLTPNILLKGPETRSQFLTPDLENIHYEEESKAVTKRLQYLETIRCVLKKRWQKEYLHTLQERHFRNQEPNQMIPPPNSVVLYTDENQLKPKWTLGRVLKTITGKDGVVRGLLMRSTSGYEVQRPLQLIIPFEISPTENTDSHSQPETDHQKDPAPAADLPKRPRRQAAETANSLLVAQRLDEEGI